MDEKVPISTRRQFHRFKNNVLVESGTLLGDGIQDALNCGFKHVISFEVVAKLVDDARKRFKGQNVMVVYDTSANMFPYIEHINEPITFWLDGHYSFTDQTGFVDIWCPILLELDAIAKHPIKTHTILVDDMHLFGTKHFNNITMQEVVNKIKIINPKYTFSFLDGHLKNDILCATVPEQ